MSFHLSVQPACLFVYPSVHLPARLYLYACLYISVLGLSVSLFFFIFCPPLYPSNFLCACLLVWLPFYLYLYVALSVLCLFLCLFICHSANQSVSFQRRACPDREVVFENTLKVFVSGDTV